MAGSILFVIIDPTRKDQPALVRAIDMARQMDGHLHIFCCDYVKEEDLAGFRSRGDAKRTTLKKAKALVEELVAPLRKQGVPLSTEVIWNAGWYQAAAHISARESADLIIKSSYSHKGIQHPLNNRSDFYLIRNAACPVLMTKSGKSHKLETVLAAVALDEKYEEHGTLNNRIISKAKQLSRAAGAQLHLVAALDKAPGLLNMLIGDEEGLRTEQELIAERFGVDSSHVHIGKGRAADVIVNSTKSLAPQMLILGTRARKGLKGVLLGNTAEKILDQLEIDVLVIN